jgi:hypothetical protein
MNHQLASESYRSPAGLYRARSWSIDQSSSVLSVAVVDRHSGGMDRLDMQ